MSLSSNLHLKDGITILVTSIAKLTAGFRTYFGNSLTEIFLIQGVIRDSIMNYSVFTAGVRLQVLCLKVNEKLFKVWGWLVSSFLFTVNTFAVQGPHRLYILHSPAWNKDQKSIQETCVNSLTIYVVINWYCSCNESQDRQMWKKKLFILKHMFFYARILILC